MLKFFSISPNDFLFDSLKEFWYVSNVICAFVEFGYLHSISTVITFWIISRYCLYFYFIDFLHNRLNGIFNICSKLNCRKIVSINLRGRKIYMDNIFAQIAIPIFGTIF